MEKELEEAKAEIERLKNSVDDKDYIIKTQWDEAETLKALVSDLQKKEKEVKSPKNNQEGDLLEELVEKHRKVEDELKWKVEQFKHLEEAYEKLRDQFRTSKTEWETEKSSLVDEISKLQESFDDETRASGVLKSQLAMCNQAVENEKSRRKKMEEQVSEMKLSLERVRNEGFEGKMEEECLNSEINGEEEVANLRHSLRVKEMDFKDMEYKAKKLEKENQELLTSIKELQEAHIPRAVPTPSSWAKLKSRMKSLELSHKECSANLKAKEAEWSSKADRLRQELERCSSNLKIKDQVIEELKEEVESCNSSLTQLKMQNEELSLMLQLMRSEGSEDAEGGAAQLMEQLEKVRREKIGMQEDLDKLREELEEVREALDMIDSELTDQTNEKIELEYELENWISIAAHLEMQVTNGKAMRKDLELSLIEQAEVEEMLKIDTEEKDRRIGNLEQQIFLMDQEIRIEEDDTTEEDEKVSPRLQTDDDDEQLQLELLAKELEEAVVVHIMEERDYPFDQSSEEDTEPAETHERMTVQGIDNNKIRISLEGEEDICASKENASQRHSHSRKTSDSIIEERSPFRELN